MKKGLILVVLVMFLLVGCGKKEESRVIASMDSMSPTITNEATNQIINETKTAESVEEPTTSAAIPKTSRATSRASYLYVEIETEKKERHKYTFVYKTFDECQEKGNEFLPMIQKLHPEIVKPECTYLKDDNNNRYWGVLFKTCDDPSMTCNFYY